MHTSRTNVTVPGLAGPVWQLCYASGGGHDAEPGGALEIAPGVVKVSGNFQLACRSVSDLVIVGAKRTTARLTLGAKYTLGVTGRWKYLQVGQAHIADRAFDHRRSGFA